MTETGFGIDPAPTKGHLRSSVERLLVRIFQGEGSSRQWRGAWDFAECPLQSPLWGKALGPQVGTRNSLCRRSPIYEGGGLWRDWRAQGGTAQGGTAQGGSAPAGQLRAGWLRVGSGREGSGQDGSGPLPHSSQSSAGSWRRSQSQGGQQSGNALWLGQCHRLSFQLLFGFLRNICSFQSLGEGRLTVCESSACEFL